MKILGFNVYFSKNEMVDKQQVIEDFAKVVERFADIKDASDEAQALKTALLGKEDVDGNTSYSLGRLVQVTDKLNSEYAKLKGRPYTPQKMGGGGYI